MNEGLKRKSKFFYRRCDIVNYVLLTLTNFTYLKRKYDFYLIIPYNKGFFYMAKQYCAKGT